MDNMAARDGLLAVGVRLAVAGYLVWTAITVTRMWRRPSARLVRWEHLAMGLSLAVMAFAHH